MRLTPLFNLPAPGRRQTLYVVFVTLQSPVFLVNSRLGLFSATRSRSDREGLTRGQAPLIPKLRGQFAEFLNEGSHSHLRIFSSPTCVGLRYGYPKDSLEDFLGSVASATLRALRPSPCVLRECDPPDLPGGSPYSSEPTRPIVGSHSLLRLPIVITSVR